MTRSTGIGRAALRRALLLGGLWWALTGGDRSGIAWGAVIVVAATVASLAFAGAEGPSWSGPGIVRFVGTFAYGSFTGGVDVAYRALSPRLPLAPALIRYPLRSPPGPARDLFLGTVSLMPGTLTVAVRPHEADIHVLVHRAERTWDRLERLERRAAGAVGTPLEARHA